MFQKKSQLKLATYWFWTALTIIIGITLFTGFKTYQIAQAFGSPLNRNIEEWLYIKTVDYENFNVFDQSVEELFTMIDEEVDLPDPLYIYNEFDLEFDRSGQLTSFYAAVTGENEEGVFEWFLISDSDEPNQLTINSGENPDREVLSNNMLLSPLFDTLDQLSLEETIETWPAEEVFGIYYDGYRSWGTNDTGIYYLGNGGGPIRIELYDQEILGYTVSVYVSGKTETITPMRYIDSSLNVLSEPIDPESEKPEIGYQVDEQDQKMYYLTEEIGYRLAVLDAATGSRWYGLEKTEDAGESWVSVNPDPFDGRSGSSTGLKFFNEDFGFMAIARRDQATLFRTENGGEIISPVTFPDVQVPLIDDETYNPFRFPDMPYEENDELYVTVGQDPNGDYNSGAKALYKSVDDGKTWTYVDEVGIGFGND
ncbi:WD40/YVTN/BNR-like repeat-containing protein [Alkalibacterium gilvum]|uniref:WD40/YVTN/BNR-like repeat-containing protein n=1 Tax=Alkalibacterium gilvum TaxID=1130080 RepID=UPI00115FCD63|nr:hypothetical protein [Alkalibacterium gilvum]